MTPVQREPLDDDLVDLLCDADIALTDWCSELMLPYRMQYKVGELMDWGETVEQT